MEREVKDSSRGPICGQVAVCLRKRGSIKSTYERPAQKVGGRDARRMARRLVDGARVDADGLDASEKPISKSDSILGPEGRNDGDGGTKEAAATPAEKPARIIASSALHCPPIQPIRCPLLRARKCAHAPFTLDVLQDI